MSFWSRLFAGKAPAGAPPRASVQDAGGGLAITTASELDAALRAGALSASGTSVTPDSAMRVAAVYACVRIISGAMMRRL